MNALPSRALRALLGMTALVLAGCASPVAQQEAEIDPGGIRVESLRLTAGSNMLDLRFRITDAERAAPFFSRKTELQLIDLATGAQLAVPNTPKLGKLRQVARKDMSDRSYFVLFANPGGWVKAGSRVELIAGDTRVGQITVE